MGNLQRVGDSNSGGGIILSSLQGSVYANGKLVSVNSSPVSGHGIGIHSSPVTANGISNILINGIPVNILGNSDTCGHSRIGGSSDIFCE